MSTRSSGSQAALRLPKGGGAIKGIGETSQANLFSGTASHTVPIALTTGRSGFRSGSPGQLQLRPHDHRRAGRRRHSRDAERGGGIGK